MATSKSGSAKRAAKRPANKAVEEDPIESHNKELERQLGTGESVEDEAKTRAQEHEDAMDAIDPDSKIADPKSATEEDFSDLEDFSAPKVWCIGKPPTEGGTDDEYSYLTQKKLGFMARNRFFSLTAKAMSVAVRSTGSIEGMDDFMTGGGTLRQRATRLRERDFQDASSFLALAFELTAYSPNYIVETLMLWLDVPTAEKPWFKEQIEEEWNPAEDQWGLDEDVWIEMVERFIDQNYEDIRRFFVEKLPRIAKRVRAAEKKREAAQK